MADHTVTITNSIFTYGLAEPTRWNEFNWNEANWGEGTLLIPKSIGKLISNNVSPTTSVSKKTHKIILNLLNPSSAVFKGAVRTIKNNLSVLSHNEDIFKFTGNGYYYIFKRPTKDGADRVDSSYTSDSDPGTSYSVSSDPATPYTEL